MPAHGRRSPQPPFYLRRGTTENVMKKKLENFWYHYKIQTLIILAFAVIITVCIVQMAGRTDYGLYAMYAGPGNINISEDGGRTVYSSLCDAIKQVSGERDLEISIQCFTYVPKDLAEEYVKKDLYYNAYENEKTHDAYATMIANGKCTLLLLTPELYAEAKEAGALEPLENILGHAPEGAYDEYSFVFSETAFAKYFSGLDKLPDDILIAFRSEVNPSSLIGRSDGKAYAYQKEIFKKIITFGEE